VILLPLLSILSYIFQKHLLRCRLMSPTQEITQIKPSFLQMLVFYSDSCFLSTSSDILTIVLHCGLWLIFTLRYGRAVAQAVRRWFPTAAALVRVRAHVGFVVDKPALGQVLSEYLGSPANHYSTNFSIIITRGCTIGLLVALVPSGPNWTPPPTIPIKKNTLRYNN
jgi:hypothetical protein